MLTATKPSPPISLSPTERERGALSTAAMAAPGCAMPAAMAAVAAPERRGSGGALPRSIRVLSLFGASRRPPRAGPFFGRPLPPCALRRRAVPASAPARPFTPVMEWQDCSAEIVADVPCSVAYDCYSDREAIPEWMPFISSVKTLELVAWMDMKLALGNKVISSILSFYNSVNILTDGSQARAPGFHLAQFDMLLKLTVSYEIPQVLIPVASALKPFLESLLLRGLERFVTVAKSYQSRVS
ncbi:hypothetical protein Taro_045154 [Colocasia esculenta]|uniref:Coenzyme Q-binding protein COQ10 START domain-containing protein n=1 Tax=Colocasia esculenta TaxID=4460 RepID=A0A843WWC4_COLES|nr:hypothetical protein [Colocasia esculenta]